MSIRCIRNAFIFLIAFFCSTFYVYGQTYIGQREIINFEKQQYNGGTQNWKIREDVQGRMFFANNEGLLVFDGIYWQLYPLPNKTILRSIEFGADNRLYAGGQDEIGYYAPDKTGKLSYTSLKNLIPPADQKLSDIWEIVKFGNDIFFRSSSKILQYTHGIFKVYNSSWLFLGIHNNELIGQDKFRGILKFINGNWVPFIYRSSLPDQILITSISPFGKDSSIITTVRNGLFVISGNAITGFKLKGDQIDNNQHFTACLSIGEGNFLVSTYINGFYQFDKNGVISENFSKKEGIQNSNVRTLFMDKNHNIWLGLDNGIDFIAYNNAVKRINPVIFKDGGGFSVSLYNNNLFFGLSTGIFRLSLSGGSDLSLTKNTFTTISEGQSWNLSLAKDLLITGKEDGVYRINDAQLDPIEKSTGYWNFQPLNISGVSIFAAGNYNGVHLFEYKDNHFNDRGSIKNFRESSRYLVVDSNNLVWVSHPYRGIYKINIHDSSVKIYTKNDGLPSTLDNHVFKINNHILIATLKGVYQYNPGNDHFEPAPEYLKIFGNNSLRYLKEDPSGNLWFVQDKNLGVVDYSSGKPSIIYIPELKGKILSGFENVYPVNDNNVFVGGEKGFFHINYVKYKQHIRPLNVYIRNVKAIAETDSILFGGYTNSGNENSKINNPVPSLNHHWNSLHIEYSSPLFEKQSSVEYSHLLEGFDNEWSEWSKKTEKDYTNLPSGTYTFKVKARNHLNNESDVSSYVFIILPPWYQSIYAIIIYIFLLIYALYLFYKIQERKHFKKQQIELQLAKQKHEDEQSRTAYLHQLELEISEKELIKLKNEKLESEIEFKNSELASAAMNLVQKKEFLLKIKDELEHFNKSGRDSVEMSELKKILRTLSEEKKLNEEWEQFSVHFNKVQGDFLTIIQGKFPELKPHELKLCAYLRMNLSTKEIAQLMSISVRGVEISRYRLRKKLKIPTEINLFQFLFDLQRDSMKE